MANGVFNNARGKIGYYADNTLGLSGANSRFVVVVLTAVQVDNDLNNYTDLSALLANAGNTEAVVAEYSRKEHAAANVSFTPDNTANDAIVTIDSDDTWTAVTAGTDWVKLLVCWDGDNAAGTDSDIIPLTYHDFSVTPNGGDITANYDQVNGIWAST